MCVRIHAPALTRDPPPPTPIGRSRTGTGKTLAFGLPILELVAKNLAEEGTKNARGRCVDLLLALVDGWMSPLCMRLCMYVRRRVLGRFVSFSKERMIPPLLTFKYTHTHTP